MRDPTEPRLTINVSQNIEEVQESNLTLCQATTPVIFHPDAPAFLPSILTIGTECPALLVRTETAHAAPLITKTAAPDPVPLAAGGSGKINSNRALPTDGQTVSPSLPADPDSDVTSAASFGGSDGDSDYSKLSKNSPTIPADTLDLVGKIIKVEAMHDVLEGEINAIA